MLLQAREARRNFKGYMLLQATERQG